MSGIKSIRRMRRAEIESVSRGDKFVRFRISQILSHNSEGCSCFLFLEKTISRSRMGLYLLHLVVASSIPLPASPSRSLGHRHYFHPPSKLLCADSTNSMKHGYDGIDSSDWSAYLVCSSGPCAQCSPSDDGYPNMNWARLLD
jgi:hypothetical protein